MARHRSELHRELDRRAFLAGGLALGTGLTTLDLTGRGPGLAFADAEALTFSMSERRLAASRATTIGTRRATSWPRRVRITSSPASARFTSSVS